MELTISDRHHQATEAEKEYARAKLSHLPKYFNGIHRLQVTLDAGRGEKRAEAVGTVARRGTIVARAAARDFTTALDELAGKLERELLKYKARLRGRDDGALRQLRTQPPEEPREG